MNMTKTELKTILDNHKLWRHSNGKEGARANLARANLAGANLARADLAGAYLADANLARADLAGAYLAGAYLARANLADAYLADANLAGAYLADANLAGAYLADADLADAYLAGADLTRADLAGAYLAGADLTRADLTRAYLASADLASAYLADANLASADLTRADLTRAYLADAANKPASLKDHVDPTTPYERKGNHNRMEHAALYRERHPDVPVVPQLDTKILAILDSGAGVLDMGAWHTCETTHCRAGWAIHLAGEIGYELEKELGDSAAAGRAIYRASTGRSPHFFASNERALEDIRRCANEEARAS